VMGQYIFSNNIWTHQSPLEKLQVEPNCVLEMSTMILIIS
jgi:hypothetical protein